MGVSVSREIAILGHEGRRVRLWELLRSLSLLIRIAYGRNGVGIYAGTLLQVLLSDLG